MLKWLKEQSKPSAEKDLILANIYLKVKKQSIAERNGLLDVRKVLGFSKMLHNDMETQHDDEKQIHKQLFNFDLQLSNEEFIPPNPASSDHSRLQADKSFANEANSGHMTQPNSNCDNDELGEVNPVPEPEQENEKSTIEIKKIERLLFRSNSRSAEKDNRSPSPKFEEYKPLLRNPQNKSNVNSDCKRGFDSRKKSNPAVKFDPMKEIKMRTSELARMVAGDLGNEELKAVLGALLRQMVAAIDSHSKEHETIGGQERESVSRKPRERTMEKTPAVNHFWKMPHPSKKSLSPEISKLPSQFDLYTRREPLQTLNSTENMQQQEGGLQLTHKNRGAKQNTPVKGSLSSRKREMGGSLLSGDKRKLSGAKLSDSRENNLDLSILRKHNFSYDFINAFQS